MFGSMHRIRRNKRNRTDVTIQYVEPVTQAEVYYEMAVRAIKKRRALRRRMDEARKIVHASETISPQEKKALRKLLR